MAPPRVENEDVPHHGYKFEQKTSMFVNKKHALSTKGKICGVRTGVKQKKTVIIKGDFNKTLLTKTKKGACGERTVYRNVFL